RRRHTRFSRDWSSDVCSSDLIPVIQVDRGGQVTYHGPGQLVVYLLIDLTRRKLGVRALVDEIEQAIVRALGEYGIESAPRSDAPGVYVNGAQIASLGLLACRGRSLHGEARNVDMNQVPLSRMCRCGCARRSMSQVSGLMPGVSAYNEEPRLLKQLITGLGGEQV